ncbi:hypothetical protein D9M71_544550 [compost metagenome]
MQQRVDERPGARRVPVQDPAEQALLLHHLGLHLGHHHRKLAAPDHRQHRHQQASQYQGAVPRRPSGRLSRCTDPGGQQRRRSTHPGAVRRRPGARHAHCRGSRPDPTHADRRAQPDPEHRRTGRSRPDAGRHRHRAVDLARTGAGKVRARYGLRQELQRTLRPLPVQLGRLGLQHRAPVGRRGHPRAQPGQRKPDQGPGRSQVPAAQGTSGMACSGPPEPADGLCGEGEIP